MDKAAKITIGLGVGLAAAVGIYALVQAAPPPPPPPSLANLYGKITDGETGYPIQGALFTLNGLSVYTDSDGYFAFTDLAPGSYSGSVSKEGYETVSF